MTGPSPIVLRVAVVLLLLTTMFSCTTPGPAPLGRPSGSAKRPIISAASLEKHIHTLINRERTREGLSALAWNSALSDIARKHSRDMGIRKYFSHDSPEGMDFAARYRRDRFSCAIAIGNTVYGGAENIFQNNLYDSVTTVNGKAYYDWNSEERIAETTVQGWMDSPCSPKVIMSYFSQAEMSYRPPVKGGRDGERHYHDEHEGSKAAASYTECDREKNHPNRGRTDGWFMPAAAAADYSAGQKCG